jgi:N utilization substance protein B
MSEKGEERHRARERAFELLYEQTIKDCSTAELLNQVALRPDPYTVELLLRVESRGQWAEGLLGQYSIDWPVDRMPLVDRLIMTLALCELTLDNPPPKAVVFDEAVEFAKVFSSDGSPSFVNGLLSACTADETYLQEL